MMTTPISIIDTKKKEEPLLSLTHDDNPYKYTIYENKRKNNHIGHFVFIIASAIQNPQLLSRTHDEK